MKKQLVPLLALTLLANACAASVERPTLDVKDDLSESQVIENQETENRYEATVDYLDAPEVWSAVEVVEGNRDYYVTNAPDYWVDYENPEEYPEYIKNSLSVWKTGVFKGTEFEGQSLVLVHQQCDGPCDGSFFRYAVDESADTWTLLREYSNDSKGWAGGPMDAESVAVSIPELNAPEMLEIYDNDETVLADAWSRLNPFVLGDGDTSIYTELSDVPDLAFQYYYQAQGCIYGVLPDGLLARYTVVPKEFSKEPNSVEPITGELTLESTDGTSETKDFSLSAGGCGLMWSCLDIFELTASEKQSLEQVGTLGGRAVYLPVSIGERPELSSDYDLTQRIYNSYDSYVARQDYSEQQEDAVSIEEYLEMNTLFLLALDNGYYTLTFDSEYAPTAECGKPVIYLYPEYQQLVNVQVGIETFTKTIPAYGEKGWTVWAKPNGLLTNLADGLKYPYLFWEGQSYSAESVGETWTLPTDEVTRVLPTALAEMGFTSQESADFMEFWGPHLETTNTPHVEFAFVNETVMDEIAPLSIQPLPDQVIRVFMYYRGVEEAGQSMPIFRPVPRYGFTVFEWGGSLY